MAHYPLTLIEDGDAILVLSPMLEEVTTFGENEEEALERGQAAVMEAIAGRIANGQVVPVGRVMMAPGQPVARIDFGTEAKIRLHNTLLHEGMTRADLMRRMKVARPTVDRLFDLDHQSRADQIEAAFNAMGYDTLMDAKRRA